MKIMLFLRAGSENRFTFSTSPLVAAAAIFLASFSLQVAPARNVILFIGDGMGLAHVKASRYYNGGALSFEGLPFQAQMTTYSANNAVTDSAAARQTLSHSPARRLVI